MPDAAMIDIERINTPMAYTHDTVPEPGQVWQVAPGVHWVRMPLPFDLNHINLWILEDGDGWTLIDTGFANDKTREIWDGLLNGFLKDRPIKQMIVTHFHPDHIGLAGWLQDRVNAPLVTTHGEFTMGRVLGANNDERMTEIFFQFYVRAGFTKEMLDDVKKRGNPFPKRVAPLPVSFQRIMDNDDIKINGHTWRVITGYGHSPEHASLWCPELKLLISGDQILPRITTNISVWPQEPEANPLKLFLQSLASFTGLDDDTLVLPSHDRPFTTLKPRLEQLAHHHDQRLNSILAACAEPHSAFDALKYLFDRKLDETQVYFAIGESIAHLHYLVGKGLMTREIGGDGVARFKTV